VSLSFFLFNAALVAIGGGISSVFAGRLRSLVSQVETYRLIGSQLSSQPLLKQSVDVMIPAYNEELNIEACVRSVLASSPSRQITVWVVDDQSSDRTWEIVTNLAAEGDDRLKILRGSDRPRNEIWMGKNWACAQAMDQATGEYVLFIDADVMLTSGAIETAVAAAGEQQWDLLTGWPTIVCGCFGEWVAQPIVASMFALAFKPEEIADPQCESMFAVGPFMLFRRAAYDRVGGHRALRSEIVEDVELARAIQQAGLSLHFAYLNDLAFLRMYRTFGALWEGWTKNWHLGSQRNVKATLYSAFIAFCVFSLPWLSFGQAVMHLRNAVFDGETVWGWGLMTSIAGLFLLKQYEIRQNLAIVMNLPTRYWWLSGLGGLVVSAIAIVSWIKTETGWGWTWRGRSLKLSSAKD
jgi:glycosyltransferase involved in cell wall biosynthesis